MLDDQTSTGFVLTLLLSTTELLTAVQHKQVLKHGYYKVSSEVVARCQPLHGAPMLNMELEAMGVDIRQDWLQ